jgi:hypothetical protein
VKVVRKERVMMFTFLAFTLIFFGLILAKFPLQIAGIIGGVSGWLAFLIRFFYQRWEKFYLLVQRIRFLLLNPQTNWDMTIRYSGEFSNSVFQELIKLVSEKDTSQKVHLFSPNQIEVRMQSMILQMFYESPKEIEVQILNYPVTYEKALDTLTSKLSPLLEQIGDHISAKTKTYFLTINFEEKNPYYGILISKLSEKEILNFNVVFKVEDCKVDVYKNKLILQTNSIGELHTLTKNYLALSPR